MSLLGVPGTIGFSGKWVLATSGLEVGAAPWVVAVSASALLTAAYVWRVLAIAIRSAPEPAGTRPLARRIAWSAFALAVFTVALGLGSGPFVELLP
jgi:multicomponent Na+:H+ antiporter subunit D